MEARSGLRVGASSYSSRGPGWGCEATPRLSMRGCGGTARIGSKANGFIWVIGHWWVRRDTWGGLLLPHPWACSPSHRPEGDQGLGRRPGANQLPHLLQRLYAQAGPASISSAGWAVPATGRPWPWDSCHQATVLPQALHIMRFAFQTSVPGELLASAPARAEGNMRDGALPSCPGLG